MLKKTRENKNVRNINNVFNLFYKNTHSTLYNYSNIKSICIRRNHGQKTSEPTSYEQIYKYIEHVLDECSTFIDDAEIDYYQGSSPSIISTARNQITTRPLSVLALQAWSHPLNELRDARFLHDIRNGKTIRELLS